ncbi:UDP-glucose 4-epimerase [Pelagibacterales bacterium SAG-MED01]|nr:UDP-glucose 4-epimerase [Pelagibacterales bacterium SAG-MED01]
MKIKILITGASGYIGSCLYFYLKQKFRVLGVDKINNKFKLIKKCDLTNSKKLDRFLRKEKPNLIVHLAAQSLVDETINKNKYYLNNVVATKNLVNVMKKNNLNNLIFSSTAALYKYNNKVLNEKSRINPKSTYARTKNECEKIIRNSKINSIILRFFNVCSSLQLKKKIIGEFHNPETHLIPTIVYKNLLKQQIYVYGNNYKTKDGTCVRDYVHIKDICNAIEKSIKFLLMSQNNFEIINIGSSSKKTNFEILDTVKKITNISNNFKIVKRRKGDVDFLTCSIVKAKKKLQWKPIYSNIKNIIKDEIKWVNYLINNKKFRKFKNYL